MSVHFNITVYTSDIISAGTDANVFIQIFGKRSYTDKIRLRKSSTNSKPFQRAQKDVFIVEAEDVGPIKKIRIGHDDTKFGSGWHLDKVKIRVEETGDTYLFNSKSWFDKNEGDRAIERELYSEIANELDNINDKRRTPSIEKIRAEKTRYFIQTVTSDIPNASTGANVYIQLIGSKNVITDKIPLKKSLDNPKPFQAGQTDTFAFDMEYFGRIKRIIIGHDGILAKDGWHLKRVIIDTPDNGEKWSFDCKKWLDIKKDDQLIERELELTNFEQYEVKTKSNKMSPRTSDSNKFIVDVLTSNKSNAGTDSKVFIQLFYKKYFTEKMLLKKSLTSKKPFEKGQTDRFELENIEFKEIDKIIIGHDNSGRIKSWHLDSVQVTAPSLAKAWFFPCNKRFDLDYADGKIERELFPDNIISNENKNWNEIDERKSKIQKPNKWIVDVLTSNKNFAGTDAKVYIELFSSKSKTGKILLKKSLTNENPFEQGQNDRFELENIELDDVKKIRIGHDNSGIGAGWHLQSVKIRAQTPTGFKTWFFPCGRWLDAKEEDKKIERELYLDESYRNEDEEFVNQKPNINKPMYKPDDDNRYFNSYQKPNISKPTRFTVDVSTSNKLNAGTNAKVYLQLIHRNNCTDKIFLTKSLTNNDPFEQAHTDRFVLDNVQLEDIDKIKIGHDNSGFGPGWHLHSVNIEAPSLGKSWYFPCDRWFDKKEDDGKIERELTPDNNTLANKLLVDVTTSDIAYAGTNATVFIQFFSNKSRTEKIILKKSQTHKDPFEQGHTDRFEINNLNLKDIDKIRIGHDNSGLASGWHLHSVKIEAPALRKKWIFPCGMWFDSSEGDKQIERDLLPTANANDEIVTYRLNVVTSDLSNSGTDANVYVKLFGKNADSNIIQLKTSRTHRNKFERGQTDIFEYKLPYLGDLHLLKVGHDGSGVGQAWHLSNILVECIESKEIWKFYYKDWLSTENGFEYEVDLEPGEFDSKRKQYIIDVFTGDCENAGTDANVFLTIYGNKGSSGERKLASSKNNLNKFEQNQVDRFIFGASNLGDLFKIKIRHDNSGAMSGWFLDKVEITDGKHVYKFICKKWLADDEDDQKIERIIFEKNYKLQDKPEIEKNIVPYRPIAPKNKTYYISVITGGKSDGIDANVYIQLYGDEEISDERRLRQSKTHDKKFGKYQIDLFPLEFKYLGTLFALKIRHDNVGVFNDWYLERVEVHVDDYNYKFYCKNWLASNKKDGKIERTLIEENALVQFEEIDFS